MTPKLGIACADLGSIIAVCIAAAAQARMRLGVHSAQATVAQVIATFDNPD
jgi:hypothetical protein